MPTSNARLEPKATLHGRAEAIEREITDVCRHLDEIEFEAGEDWLMKRDWELGRVE